MANLKQKIIILVLTIGAFLIFIFQHGLYTNPQAQQNQEQNSKQTEINHNSQPEVISTNPENLEGSIILPTQVIEITFNYPLENVGEFKSRIDPKADYRVKLSDDRKTAKIIPIPSFQLGAGYTLFILPDSKFDGKKTLGKDIIYHFNTISYRGV